MKMLLAAVLMLLAGFFVLVQSGSNFGSLGLGKILIVGALILAVMWVFA